MERLADLVQRISSSAASACRAAYLLIVVVLITFTWPCSHNASTPSRNVPDAAQTAVFLECHKLSRVRAVSVRLPSIVPLA